ncbi:unnamed protein product [Peronospora destructor]|uniref:Uncharacterized protein n=1 Tax=Peronospora destructor TaxID=86335 RepID=A0AAV0UJA3_9STRA|nr:unnamed protein product [Peronospora destructor]
MIAVFWYMSDVAKSGHTNFARSGQLPHPPTIKGCLHVMNVAPNKRKVIVFDSMLPNGVGNPMSLHAGYPVKEIQASGEQVDLEQAAMATR